MMGYEQHAKDLNQFDEIIRSLGVKFGNDAPIKKDFDNFREFLGDRDTLTEPDLFDKWKPRFKEFYDALIVSKRMIDAVLTLEDQTRIKSRLKKVLSGSLVQNFKPETAKDHFYELELAAFWKNRGFTIELAEPDFVVSGGELSSPLGVACKFPSSWKQIHDHVSKGYKQITQNGNDGLVAIGLEQLFCAGMENYLDFNQNEKPPLQIMKQATTDVLMHLIVERQRDYPAEKPIDGLMLTISAIGLYGKPVEISRARFATLHCDLGNPRFADFGVLCQEMNN